MSAIDKQAVSGRARVDVMGFVGDEQGDRRVHGGEDKAVHLYSFEHYAAWRLELGEKDVLRQPGAFGENLSTIGLSEGTVCLGDRLTIGSACLEVSQGRQPCWKLNDRFGVSDMALHLQQSLRTGWYCRVIAPGAIGAGDAIHLVHRPFPAWPLSRLMALLYQRCLDKELLTGVLALPLVPAWRKVIAQRLETGRVEDWRPRTEGPV